MQEKKKNKGKFLYRILPFICATLLLLGSCMTVFADSYYTLPTYLRTNWVILDMGSAYEADYGYRYFLLTADGSIVYDDANNQFHALAYGNNKTVCYYRATSLDFSNVSSSLLYDTVSSAAGYNPTIVTASSNVYYGTTSGVTDLVFFWLPIAVTAKPLTGMVQNQTQTILPIVIGCLALLVGLAVLAKKLRIFVLK